MDEVELTIIAISSSESQKGNYVIVFEEIGGFRRLTVIIGKFEAQSIAIALENMTPTRPLTFDLFYNTLLKLGAKLNKIIIKEIKDGVFYSQLIVEREGEIFEIDSRTSDAIALAVRFEAPIYASSDVMEEASIILESPSRAFTNKRGKLEDYSLEELERILSQLIKKEDYRSAVRIRNAIKLKKEKN